MLGFTGRFRPRYRRQYRTGHGRANATRSYRLSQRDDDVGRADIDRRHGHDTPASVLEPRNLMRHRDDKLQYSSGFSAALLDDFQPHMPRFSAHAANWCRS